MEAFIHKVKYIFWRLRYYIFILLLLVISFLVYRYTSVLTINQVVIDSINQEKLSQVDKTKAEDDTNWVIGKKYFDVNIEDIKKGFEGNAFVKSTLVTKIFPNTLLIYIQERIPFVSLEIDNNTCILLDQESFVLLKAEGNCKEINNKYTPIPLSINDPKMSFIENSQSTYYQVRDVVKLIEIFGKYNLGINDIKINDNIMKVRVASKKYFVFSQGQDITVQLTRMVAVMPEIEKSNLKYTTLDLRFSRPVLRK